ncbi:MAG: type II secretion system inner membrane protein GspF [Gammaproteobacteria bacterium]|nr:type II secretion system inner membrane protein GspF [Gammaproteobacteria bacterium]
MAAFEYLALDAKGKEKKGVLEGDNARQVRAQLREMGLAPLAVDAVGQKAAVGEAPKRTGFVRRVSAADLALLTRQLATLVRSAMPLEESLKAVAEQTEKPKLKSMLLAVRARVVEGHTLADGLGDFPGVFDRLYCAMVAAGERSGHLDEVLERLADYTESRQQMKSKISLALVYPTILTLMAIAVVSGLLAYVVPKVVSQFEHMHAELPFMTKVMIGLSDGVRAYGLFILAGLVGAFFLVKYLLKTESRQRRFDGWILRAPMFGKVIRGLNTARFARTLSILTASAVPLLEGLRIAGEVLSNLALKAAVEEATARVREGTSLRQSLAQSGYFPPMMLHMIASGENSGELEDMLKRAADNQDREFENLVAVSLSLFEPLLILTMGLVVLMIVMAILLPIFQLNTLVNG